MTQLTLKWILVLAALFALGPIAASLVAPLRLTDGSHAASLFTDGSFTRGLIAGLGVLGLALAIGVISGRLVVRDMGLTCAGLVVAWAAWRFSTVDRAIARSGDSGMFTMLAIEGLVVALAGLAIAAVIALTAKDRTRGLGLVATLGHDAPLGETVSRAPLFIATLIGIIAGGIAVWLIAAEALKGQCVLAAVSGGIAAGAAAQLYASTQRLRLGVLIPMASFAVLAAAAPLVTQNIHGAKAVADAMGGNLFPLGKLGPLDWLAGALLGTPIGIAWANSMLEKEHAPAHA